MSFLAWLLAVVALTVPSANSQLFERAKITRACDSALDKVELKRVTMLSKYVFTGKVYSVTSMNSTRVYKVNIRRVLKGDLNDIGVAVRFGTPYSLRFSDATVMVESSNMFHCPPLRVRTYAIFLTEKHLEKGALRLSLVVEPVLLTLRSIGIIEAAIKEETLDEDILVILGDAPKETRYGPNIHKELASRWTDIIKNGLTKEKRSEIKSKYLPPENCKTIDAPKLNLEAQAAVTDMAIKRDKAICDKQAQIGCALSALALAFENLIKNKENLQCINYISDAARLLCDHQHIESKTRRYFILQGLDQGTRDSIKDAKIDQWLFGEDFSEKLKASKAIKKSGQEISNKSTKPICANPQHQKKSLNFKGPVTNLPRGQTYHTGPQRNYQTYKKQAPQVTSVPQTRRTYPHNRAPMRPVNNRN